MFKDEAVFLTSPGLSTPDKMSEAVADFGWPDSMTHAIDPDGSLWQHFGIRFRGSWLFIDDDGTVSRTSPHPPKDQVEGAIEGLIAD